MTTLFLQNLQQHLELFQGLSRLDDVVAKASATIAASLSNGGKLMICGNGGSAADSQHIAAEFTGRFIDDRRPLAALALSTDTSALTCIGNDYSFAEVFARQVRGLGRTGDVLLGISTSGNSENVLRAVHTARECGISCIGLLGRDGGKLAPLCDVAIVVPSAVTARIQEAHILVGHTLCGAVEQALGLVGSTGNCA
jgi:D-sedoheptulose 7-phosphate isomerase